jgi:hypothetical protein
VYAGCLCCAEHWVKHSAEGGGADALLQTENVGQVGVVLLCRSRVFRASRGSIAKGGPNPHVAYKAALAGLTQTLREAMWLSPTLASCVALEQSMS